MRDYFQLLLQESRLADFEERTQPVSIMSAGEKEGCEGQGGGGGGKGPYAMRRPFDLGMEGRASSARVK